jgi:hypothetical protein
MSDIITDDSRVEANTVTISLTLILISLLDFIDRIMEENINEVEKEVEKEQVEDDLVPPDAVYLCVLLMYV